jgi:hypothetical protein
MAPSPPGATPRLIEATLVHVDAASDRLIVAWSPIAGDVRIAADGMAVLVLVAQPGEAVYARPHVVEATLVDAGWLVLRAAEMWQRLQRPLAVRAAVALPVIGYRHPATGGSLPLRGMVRDLSSTGLLLDTSDRLSPQDHVVLEIPLPDGEPPLQVKALVVRMQRVPEESRTSRSAGCQFEALGPSDQTRLAAYVASQVSRVGQL